LGLIQAIAPSGHSGDSGGPDAFAREYFKQGTARTEKEDSACCVSVRLVKRFVLQTAYVIATGMLLF